MSDNAVTVWLFALFVFVLLLTTNHTNKTINLLDIIIDYTISQTTVEVKNEQQ